MWKRATVGGVLHAPAKPCQSYINFSCTFEGPVRRIVSTVRLHGPLKGGLESINSCGPYFLRDLHLRYTET
eukprot:157987-Amphidinium_carterae.2